MRIRRKPDVKRPRTTPCWRNTPKYTDTHCPSQWVHTHTHAHTRPRSAPACSPVCLTHPCGTHEDAPICPSHSVACALTRTHVRTRVRTPMRPRGARQLIIGKQVSGNALKVESPLLRELTLPCKRVSKRLISFSLSPNTLNLEVLVNPVLISGAKPNQSYHR